MKGSGFLFAACGQLLAVNAQSAQSSCAALEAKHPRCEKLIQRKAWHTLTNPEKKSYLDAEVCLLNTPLDLQNSDLLPRFPVAKTLFQALQEQHQIQSDTIHEVGIFLPYHRYMTHAHETLLRTKCNYTGAQPYWDEERDAAHFANSSIFDAEFGFGGREAGCLKDGPFKDYELVIGPGKNNTKHCLERAIDDVASQAASKFFLDFVRNSTTFEEAWERIEFYPHSAGHSGVGGEMLNPISSPGDPMFYVHHAFVDKLWWDWQVVDLEKRLYAIGGPTVKDPHRPAPIPEGFTPGGDAPARMRKRHEAHVRKHSSERRDEANQANGTTTLEHGISLFGLLEDVTAEDVMDIRNELLCYEYI